MQLAISTHWNTARHRAGEAMIDEILELGFRRVELGYDLTLDLVSGVRLRVADGSVSVGSVHNFCPVPVGAPYGHPELFHLASPDARARNRAVLHTANTIRFAAETGARHVVAHAGRVDTRTPTSRLIELAEAGRRYSPVYERARNRLLLQRDRKAPRCIDSLCDAIDQLIPTLDDSGVQLCFEILPSWEAIPSEAEMQEIGRRYAGAPLRYWHDLGHAQIRENLGLIGHLHWLKRLRPLLAGLHVHDVAPPAHDHLLPPHGALDFARFAAAAAGVDACVLEPAPGTPPDVVREASAIVRQAWSVSQSDQDKDTSCAH